MNQFYKTELLIGESGINKLKNSNVIVFGIGGVGGHVCEMLVRAGVGSITIVDFDVVDITNINRQVIALNSVVGKPKVDVMEQRLLDINPNLNITKINDRVSIDNVNEILSTNYNFVVDAIDSVTNKIDLIVCAHNKGLNIVSAMGAGNRTQIPYFEVSDIYKTSVCPLAKIMRKKLKEKNIENHTVVFSKLTATPVEGQVGSISYYPAMCGCVLAAYVINQLIEQ